MRKCIKCKTAVATVREKYDPETHVYCGLACQKQYYSIGLKTGQDEAGPAIDDDDVVGLIGSKGEKIRVTRSEAKRMGRTIELLLEDAGADDYIPLTSIPGYILKYLKSIVQGNPPTDQRMFDQDMYFDLMISARYLETRVILEDLTLLTNFIPRLLNISNKEKIFVTFKDSIVDFLIFTDSLSKDTIETIIRIIEEFKNGKTRFEPILNNLKTMRANFGGGNFKLWHAVVFKRNETLRRLLCDPRVSPNTSIMEGAVRKRNVEAIQMLLEDGRSNPWELNSLPLRTAATNGYEEIVRLLLAVPQVSANIDGLQLAFNEAILNNHVNIAQLLLSYPGVTPDYRYARGTLLSHAAESNNAESIKFLLRFNNVDPTTFDNLAIRNASKKGNSNVVRILLTHPNVDPAANDNEAIQMASRNGHHKVVELLLSIPDVNPAANDNFAIKQAAKNGKAKVVELLLADPRVDPSAEDNFAIRNAAAKGMSNEVIQRLLAHPLVDPTSNNNEAIRMAAQNKKIAALKLLLADGRADYRVIDLNAVNANVREMIEYHARAVGNLKKQRLKSQLR